MPTPFDDLALPEWMRAALEELRKRPEVEQPRPYIDDPEWFEDEE